MFVRASSGGNHRDTGLELDAIVNRDNARDRRDGVFRRDALVVPGDRAGQGDLVVVDRRRDALGRYDHGAVDDCGRRTSDLYTSVRGPKR